jgi:uncharacterized protein YciI
MAAAPTHHLLLYEYVEDMAERRRPYREAHLARIKAEQEAGHVTLAGALGDPPHAGAIVFRDVDRSHIEAFTRDDPYVAAGLVISQRIEPWRLV